MLRSRTFRVDLVLTSIRRGGCASRHDAREDRLQLVKIDGSNAVPVVNIKANCIPQADPVNARAKMEWLEGVAASHRVTRSTGERSSLGRTIPQESIKSPCHINRMRFSRTIYAHRNGCTRTPQVGTKDLTFSWQPFHSTAAEALRTCASHFPLSHFLSLVQSNICRPPRHMTMI